MKKTRILALVMALAMSATAFTGCSGDSGSGSETSGGGSDNNSGEVTKLSWYGIGGNPTAGFNDSLVEVNKYLKEKLNVELDWKIFGWSEYTDKFNTMVNGGDYFDIMFASDAYYSRFVSKGAFMDISEKVKTASPDLYELVPEVLWEGVTINGKIYGVPTYKDSSLTQFWYFDHDKVEKYNIDVKSIHTMDDLDKIFYQVKEGEEAESGKTFHPVNLTKGNPWNGFFNDFDNLCSGVGAVGVRIDDESRKVVNVLDDEEVLHNLDLLHKWFNDGIINQDANVSNETYKKNFFGSGQGWPAAEVTWAIGQDLKKVDLTDPIDGPFYTSATTQGSINCLYSGCKNPDAALKFLELVNTDSKLRDMLQYGKEGVDFEYTEKDGKTVVHQISTDNYKGPAGYAIGCNFTLTLRDTEPATQWDEVKAQNESAKNSVCMGFILDTSNIENEIAACSSEWDTYKADMLTGARDPKELVPELKERLKSAGIDTIIAEAQKQVDAYFSK